MPHYKLVHKSCRTNFVMHSYFYRLPPLCNSLTSIDISLSYHSIRIMLLKFFHNHFITNFNPFNKCTYHFLCPGSKYACQSFSIYNENKHKIFTPCHIPYCILNCVVKDNNSEFAFFTSNEAITILDHSRLL